MHLQREKNALTQTPGNLLCEETFSTFEVLFEDLYKLLSGQSTFRKRQPTETTDGDYVYSPDYLVSSSFQMSDSDFRAWEYYRQGRYHTLAESTIIRTAFVGNKKLVTTSLGTVSLETFTLTNNGQSYRLRTSITQSSRSRQNAKRIPLRLHILWKHLRGHSAPPIVANHKYIYFPEQPPAREGMAIESLGPQKPGHVTMKWDFSDRVESVPANRLLPCTVPINFFTSVAPRVEGMLRGTDMGADLILSQQDHEQMQAWLLSETTFYNCQRWEFEGDNSWHPFTREECVQLQEAFYERFDAVSMDIVRHSDGKKDKYVINFATGIQQNQRTRSTRRLRLNGRKIVFPVAGHIANMHTGFTSICLRGLLIDLGAKTCISMMDKIAAMHDAPQNMGPRTTPLKRPHNHHHPHNHHRHHHHPHNHHRHHHQHHHQQQQHHHQQQRPSRQTSAALTSHPPPHLHSHSHQSTTRAARTTAGYGTFSTSTSTAHSTSARGKDGGGGGGARGYMYPDIQDDMHQLAMDNRASSSLNSDSLVIKRERDCDYDPKVGFWALNALLGVVIITIAIITKFDKGRYLQASIFPISGVMMVLVCGVSQCVYSLLALAVSRCASTTTCMLVMEVMVELLLILQVSLTSILIWILTLLADPHKHTTTTTTTTIESWLLGLQNNTVHVLWETCCQEHTPPYSGDGGGDGGGGGGVGTMCFWPQESRVVVSECGGTSELVCACEVTEEEYGVLFGTFEQNSLMWVYITTVALASLSLLVIFALQCVSCKRVCVNILDDYFESQ